MKYDVMISILRGLANSAGGSNVNMPMMLNDAADAIEDLQKQIPSEDVVEVVRCKDCKHRPILLGTAPCPPDDIRCGHHYGHDLTCPYLCDDNYYSRIPADDWFCNHGERMEGE